MKKFVPWEECVIPREESTKQQFCQWKISQENVYIEISAGNWKQRFYNGRHFFPTLYSKNKRRGGLEFER